MWRHPHCSCPSSVGTPTNTTLQYLHKGNKDIGNDRNSEERFNLDEDESTRYNNGDKNDDESLGKSTVR